MRTDQYIGLNGWAQSLLAANCVDARVVKLALFEDETKILSDEIERVPLYTTEVIGDIKGAFWPDDVVANLHRYTFPNGDVYEEFLQASPWSSGPCYFIALKEGGDGAVIVDSLWPEEKINAA